MGGAKSTAGFRSQAMEGEKLPCGGRQWKLTLLGAAILAVMALPLRLDGRLMPHIGMAFAEDGGGHGGDGGGHGGDGGSGGGDHGNDGGGDSGAGHGGDSAAAGGHDGADDPATHDLNDTHGATAGSDDPGNHDLADDNSTTTGVTPAPVSNP